MSKDNYKELVTLMEQELRQLGMTEISKLSFVIIHALTQNIKPKKEDSDRDLAGMLYQETKIVGCSENDYIEIIKAYRKIEN